MVTDPLTRLVALAAEHGMTVDSYVTRLLDRDPHDHQHRCPTCARRAAQEAAESHHPDQLALLDATA